MSGSPGPPSHSDAPADPASAARRRLAAIAIGRNEGQRLVRCLESLRQGALFDRIVYVDSGSIDASAERAETMGVRVVRLATGPYTAARGRQAGLDELGKLGADEIEYVQFIDGDCILNESWIGEAVRALDADANVAGVCARRREIGRSFYSRMIDIDWDIRPGEVPFVGGDWLARWSAIRAVGGWSIDLIAGEEPDLCFRMRDRGWRILRLAREQTLHDIAMDKFRAYWRRAVRSGYAYAEVGWKHRRGLGREWIRPTIGIVLSGFVLPIAIGVLTWLYWPAAVVAGLLWIRPAASMLRYCRRKGVPWADAVWYTALNMVCKVAAAIGVFKYLWSSVRGSRQTIIEYKGAELGVESSSSGPMADNPRDKESVG